MNKEALWTKNFIVISIATFFLFSTYYSLLVTLPNAAMQQYGVSESVAGLYTTVFLLAAIIIRPFIGSFIKWFGKRKVLLFSFLIFTISSFSYNLFDSFLFVLFIRFFHGIGFGLATTITTALIADIVSDSRKGEGMGYYVMSMNIAMVLGPFIGLSIYGKFNITALFWTTAISSLMAFILSLISSSPEEDVSSHTLDEQTLFEKRAVPIALISAYLGIAYSSILSFLAVFAIQVGLQSVSGYFFSVFAIVLIISRPFTGRWFDQYGPNVIIYPAIFLFSLGMFCLGHSKGVLLFLVAAGLLGVGWGTLFPSFQTLAVQSTVPGRWPVATATFLSIFDIGIGLGSFIAGLLIKKITLSQMYTYFSFYIFVGLFLYYFVQRNRPTKKEEYTEEKAKPISK